ncbi:MAG: AraC family transcriptional regulator [Clostridia bacterium]
MQSFQEVHNYEQEQLPLRIFKRDIGEGFGSFLLHWHEEIEVLYIYQGKGQVQINLTNYQVESGDILIISPESMHGGNNIGDTALGCYALVFPLTIFANTRDKVYQAYFRPLVEQEMELMPLITKSNFQYLMLKNRIMNIINLTEKRPLTYDLQQKMELFGLLTDVILTGGKRAKIEAPELDKGISDMRRLIKYMTDNSHKKLTLENLAEYCGYSKYHFLRLFKKNTGCSCIAYLNQVRLEKAAQALQFTDDQVSSICYEVGFDNVSYFIRAFKKHYRFSPLKYRNKMK